MRRRSILACACAGVLGTTAVVTNSTGTVAAEIEELDVAGEDTHLEEPPSFVELSVSGTYEYGIETEIDQIDALTVALSITYDGVTEEMETQITRQPAGTGSGSYEFTVELLDHPALEPEDFIGTVGEQTTLEFSATVEARVVDNGETLESHEATDSFTITVTTEGISLGLNGSGSVSIG